jgi:alkylmercury lyase
LPYLSSVDSIPAMTKPLLPAIDEAGQLREAAFAMLVRQRRPLGLHDLARLTGLESAAVREINATLAGAGWLDLDEAGRVTGAAGLSLTTGQHRLTLGGTPFRTWCAYDALGITAALEADALVETACGQCGKPIRIEFRDGVPERAGPERLWLADGGDDLRSSFCTPTVLLCGEAHGAVWAEARAGRGRLLDLAEGAREGGSEWAGCAEATRRLA